MPVGLALWLTLISSKYLCLEHIFMIPKVFESLKFYYIPYFFETVYILKPNAFQGFCLIAETCNKN